MTAIQKQETVSFKLDKKLLDAMHGIPNRSEFIRAAVAAALDNTCPLCKGHGILTPDQRKHWDEFARSHGLEECRDCHALHLTCVAAKKRRLRE